MRKYLFILFFISFVLPGVSFSETSLWKISKNGNNLYLGGTIHMLKKSDFPLPAEFSEAFKKSNKLVFETNIDLTKTPGFALKMSQMLTYPAGKTLKDAINDKTYNALKSFLAKNNIPINNFLSFRPSMVVLVLTVIELQKMGMSEPGVDEYFHNKAKKAGKATEYFETIDEQLEFLRTMGQGSENEMILSTINDMGKMQSMMNQLKSAWKSGDENKLVEVGLADMIRDFPGAYQSLLVKRNNSWMPYIEKMMTDKKVEMVLVGALHLVGKDGLLQQLRNKGYRVKQF